LLPDISEIRKIRLRLNVSQRKLANQLHLNQSTIAKIERGGINPSYQVVSKIFQYLEAVEERKVGVVKDIHVTPVVYVDKNIQLRRAVEIMQAHGFKQLPVKDGELVVGSLSERSVSRQLLTFKSPRDLIRKPVGRFMEEPFPIVSELVPIPWVIPLLQHSQAVLTTHRGKVLGIVTNVDLIKTIVSG
jgi:predicted transcriptional regulator